MENENNDQQSNLGPSFLSQQDDNISNSENFQISEDTPPPAKRKKVFFIILLLLLLILSAFFFVWKKHLKQDASNTELTTAITHSNIDDIPKERWSEKDFVLKAVKQDGFYLKYASPELKADKDVVLEAVKKYGDTLEYASPELKADKDFVLVAIRQSGFTLQYASPELKADKDVVLEAIKETGYAFQYASPELQADKGVVLEAVKETGLALEYASPKFKADKDVVMEAAKEHGAAIQYASLELQNNKEIILEIVKINGYALRYVSPEMKADKDVVLEAVKKDGYALEYASPELKADKDVVLEAVKQNGLALEYASPKLQKNKEIKQARNLPKVSTTKMLVGVLYWIIAIAIIPISFIALIIVLIMVSAFNNMRAKILIYDFAIILLFSIMAFIIGQADRAIMCDCFASRYGPVINYVLGVISVAWLCYLNHSKKIKETESKWKMLAYTAVAFGIFIIANLAIVFIGEIFYVSPMNNF